MNQDRLFAVITGDIVSSSKIQASHRDQLLSKLKGIFVNVETIFPDVDISAPFGIHRGDSFQGVLSKPEFALRSVIYIRASLRSAFENDLDRYKLDARIAVGIGAIDFLPNGRGSEGDGEAFRLSGPVLDKMKGEQLLLIRTPWKKVNDELQVECALLDAIINKWSARQAEAIVCLIRDLTQEQTARELNISQPAVQYRLKGAGGWSIDHILQRYENLIRNADKGCGPEF